MEQPIESEEEIQTKRNRIMEKIECFANNVFEHLRMHLSSSEYKYLESIGCLGVHTTPCKFTCMRDIYLEKIVINATDSLRFNRDPDAQMARKIVWPTLSVPSQLDLNLLCYVLIVLEKLDAQLLKLTKQTQISNKVPDQDDQQLTDISEPLNDHSCLCDDLV
jgi:hypothetical protein